MSNAGANHSAASGKRYSPKRSNPYVPSFSITAARMTDPAVGACVWAWGNHVCSGKIGTFTANAMANEANSQRAVVVAKSAFCGELDEIEGEHGRRSAARTGRPWHRMPTSMKAEPVMVNRKNLRAA